jgi:heme-degrading monooxygenase HmoA
MYARMVKGQFKPEKYEFVTHTLEKDIIPLLKKQKGFRDELSFFAKDMKEGYAISFWDNKADLEKYEREVYPKVHEKMAEAFVTKPIAHDFEVSNSTWYKIHAA